MTDTDAPAGAPIPLTTLPNLRSLGGWVTQDGRRVRDGVLYRSTDLSKVAGPDLDTVVGLGLRTVVDLRTAPERDQRPDVAVPGAVNVALDVLADDTDAAPSDLLTILEEPARARTILGDGRAEALFVQAYRSLVSLPSARAAYHAFFTDLADPERGPTLFHCTTGKDRTGWASATTLMLLGVSEEDVLREYLLTNDQLLPALQPVFDEFAAHGGDPELLEPVLGVRTSYLETSLTEMRATYGDVETYFSEGLGVDAATQAQLRERLLTDS